MTNYNERLDEALAQIKYSVEYRETHGGCPPKVSAIKRHGIAEAKQAITSLIKELVAEAKIDELQMIETAQQNTDQWGNFCIDDTSDFSNYIGSRISELEQNLLKALEEK